MVRRWRGKPALHDHAVSVPGQSVAGSAKYLVALLTAGQELRIDRRRFCDLVRALEIALRHDTRRQRLRLGII